MNASLICRLFAYKVNILIMKNLVEPGFEGRSAFERSICYFFNGRNNGIAINIKSLFFCQGIFMDAFLYKVSIAGKKTFFSLFSLCTILLNAVNYFPLINRQSWFKKIHI